MTNGIDPTLVHRLKNQLTIIRGFADVLLAEMAVEDRFRPDAMEIRKAVGTAIDLVKEVDSGLTRDDTQPQNSQA